MGSPETVKLRAEVLPRSYQNHTSKSLPSSVQGPEEENSDDDHPAKNRHGEKKNVKKPSVKEININRATAEELRVLRGVGPVLSERIVKYRSALGGFARTNQLYEVFGLDSSVVDYNLDNLYIDGRVGTICVNTCSYLELVSHPYIGPREARAILGFVKEVRPFSSTAEIEGVNEISSDKFRKIVPYLSIIEETPHSIK
jgi:competence ComEA-like helix-hairpin-helix protein